MSCCFSQPVSRMLATVVEWLTDFLTGAIMKSRKAARSKAVASPPLFMAMKGSLNSSMYSCLFSYCYPGAVIKKYIKIRLLNHRAEMMFPLPHLFHICSCSLQFQKHLSFIIFTLLVMAFAGLQRMVSHTNSTASPIGTGCKWNKSAIA